ncbi:hypothetical protein ACFL5G_05445 [Candidatus Margulisiibacteriota bacterium]
MYKKIILHKDRSCIDIGLKKFTFEQERSSLPYIKQQMIMIKKDLKGTLTKNAGIIARAAIDKDQLYIGFMPQFIEGQRTNHHEILIPGEGIAKWSININTDLSCLFMPVLYGTKIAKQTLRKEMIILARFLLEIYFPGALMLDNAKAEAVFKALKFPGKYPKKLLELASIRFSD